MSGFDDHFLHSPAFANGEGLKLLQDLETFQVVNTIPSAADCKRGSAEKKGGRLGEVISHWPDKLQTAPSKCHDLRLFDRPTFPDRR